MIRGHYTSALVRFQDDTTVHHTNYPYFGISDGDYRALSQPMAAIYRLWCAAASEVQITHPHPRIINPHYDPLRYHQEDIITAIDNGNFHTALSYVVGDAAARRVISENEAQAARELENEIAAGSFD